MKKQRGFGAVEVILVLAVVGLVGFIGWYAFGMNKTPNEAPSNNAPQATADDKDRIVFDEWDIKATNKSGLTLIYKMSDDKKSIAFSSNELVAQEPNCTVGEAAAGQITRYTPTEKLENGKTAQEIAASIDADPTLKGMYKKVGDYYYFRVTAHGACGQKADEDPIVQTATSEAVMDLLASFESK